MSKADYLKKYMSSDDNNKKKKPKYSSSSRANGLKIIEDDILPSGPSNEAIEEAWERQIGEDQPVTVEISSSQGVNTRGSWVTIEEQGNKRKIDTDSSPPRRRKDSDASPPRRRKDSSPPRRQKETDASPPRRGRAIDPSPPRRQKDLKDASPPRRQRVEDASPPRRKENDASPPRRRKEVDSSPPRRQREKDASPPRRNENNDPSPPRRRKENNDSSPSRQQDKTNGQQVRDANGRRTTTASGHNAGLQTFQSFGEKERELQKKKEKELREFDNQHQKEETVYRDKRGRKLDMLNEFMRQQATTEGKQAKIEKAQFEWGRGLVQKESVVEQQKELELIAAEPFARSIDDPRLEEMRKQAIRDGDPMAQYITSKRSNEQSSTQQSIPSDSNEAHNTNPRKRSKPLYKGPHPPPNRFNIRPGYRWDAIDRGNGFENILLKKLSDKNSLKEDEYKWSVSDM